MLATIRAALYADRKRPGVWYIGGVWFFLALAFGLLVPYLVYLGLSGDPKNAADAGKLLATVLPDHIPATGAGLFPLFGGAVMLILGATLVGNEYRWGTFGLLFVQRPSRAKILLGQAVALALLLLIIVAATFVLVAAATAGIAAIEGQAIAWPSAVALLRAVGGSWLICLAHGSFGFFLALLFRSTATGIAVGLGWTMLIENAVSALAQVADPAAIIQKGLLSPSTGAIAHAIGAPAQFSGGTPGVTDSLSGPAACVVAGVYVVVLVALSVWVVNRRDATN